MDKFSFFNRRGYIYNFNNPIVFNLKDNTSSFTLDRLNNLSTSKSQVTVDLYSNLGLELRTKDLEFVTNNFVFTGTSDKQIRVYAPYDDLLLFNQSILFLGQPITGALDPKVFTMLNLTKLSFFANDLTGGIPNEIGNLQKLTQLNLSQNGNLGGTLPNSLYTLTELTSLTLRGTSISSTMNSSISNLTKLRFLNISSNSGITGTLPSNFGNLTELRDLVLEGTNLSGTFPDISNLTKLKKIDVTNTNFTGEAPNIPVNSVIQFFLSRGVNFDNILSIIERLPDDCRRFWCNINTNSPYISGSLRGKFRLSILCTGTENLSQAEVDEILSDVLWTAQNTSSTPNMSINIRGSVVPSSQGLADKNTLINTYGLTILTDND
jgi:hypothetical protein